MGLNISSLFGKTVSTTKVISKTGTQITKGTKGATRFKKVVLGAGSRKRKTGLKEYTIAIDGKGKKSFNATYENEAGGTVKINDLTLFKMAKWDSPDQNCLFLDLQNMLRTMVNFGSRMKRL